MASVKQEEIAKASIKIASNVSQSTTASLSSNTGTQNPMLPPRLTRTLAVILCLTSLSTKIPGIGKGIINNFALLPVATVGQSKLWNVITAGFLDTNIIAGLINVTLFLLMGKWIESSWGPRPLLFYLIIINIFSAISTYVVMLMAYVLTRIDTYFFTAVGTTNGICVALLIAIKQLIPEHEIGSSSISVSANYLPLIYSTLVIVCTAISFFSPGVLVFTLSSFQFSWLYLRYYRFNSSEGGIYGDLSESFSYASLFPTAVRSPISMIANILFIMFKPVLMAAQNLQQASSNASNNESTSNANGYVHDKDNQQLQPSTTATSMDIERRRQRALKVLDERLLASTSTSTNDTTDNNNSISTSTSTAIPITNDTDNKNILNHSKSEGNLSSSSSSIKPADSAV